MVYKSKRCIWGHFMLLCSAKISICIVIYSSEILSMFSSKFINSDICLKKFYLLNYKNIDLKLSLILKDYKNLSVYPLLKKNEFPLWNSGLKDLNLPHLQCRSQLQLDLIPGLGNSICCWCSHSHKKKKKLNCILSILRYS